jgi:uncharacterized OsmC-like protein
MTFKAAVDDPTRFKRSRTIGAHFGLMPRRYQSGEHDNPGRISKAGDRDANATLYAAANAPPMRTMAGSQIKSWGMRLMRTLPVAIGGDNEAPSPGYFGRAKVCSCLAIGIKMTVTRENEHLDTVRVAIEQDWDNRGVLAMEGVSPVPSETQISIDITSPEPEEEVGSLVARALGSFALLRTTDKFLKNMVPRVSALHNANEQHLRCMMWNTK